MTLAFVNGRFDVFHYGHLKLLEKAYLMANTVVVALDSDSKIIKDYGRPPIVPESERAAIVAAIRFCSFTCVFKSNDELKDLIKLYTPDFLVKGEDYRGKEVIGQEYCKKVIYVPRFNSSTAIKESIANR